MGRVIAGDASPSIYRPVSRGGMAGSGESTNTSILSTSSSSWSFLLLYWPSHNSRILGIYIRATDSPLVAASVRNPSLRRYDH